MLLSTASDAQVVKLIAMGAIIVVAYLIVPLIRRIRDNARKNRRERSKTSNSDSGYVDNDRSRGKKFLLYAVISIVVAIISVLISNWLYFGVFFYLFYLGVLAAFVLFVIGIVYLVKSRNN